MLFRGKSKRSRLRRVDVVVGSHFVRDLHNKGTNSQSKRCFVYIYSAPVQMSLCPFRYVIWDGRRELYKKKNVLFIIASIYNKYIWESPSFTDIFMKVCYVVYTTTWTDSLPLQTYEKRLHGLYKMGWEGRKHIIKRSCVLFLFFFMSFWMRSFRKILFF